MTANQTSYKKGNQVQLGNFKYKTPEERTRVFKELIEHLEQGFDVASFPPLSAKAIKDYCSKFPEFPLDIVDQAKRTGRKVWETKGYVSLENKDFREKTYQFIMMNKYNMSINQKSDVKIDDLRDVKNMSDEELRQAQEGR